MYTCFEFFSNLMTDVYTCTYVLAVRHISVSCLALYNSLVHSDTKSDCGVYLVLV